MKLGIGIDTGGTYTDAVLVNLDTGAVMAQAKALTTRHQLSIGIEEALQRVLPENSADVHLVSLSTTLATNALVEGQGAPVCLLLLGYDHAARLGSSLAQDLGTDRYVFLSGGHDIEGQEAAQLDLEAARQAILKHAAEVRAFAVSGYFATRNPAHEIAVQKLVTELTGYPSTAGHELSQELDALGRATTAALNARLIPLICDLIAAVEGVLVNNHIEAPLMVVKGDGSLMRADTARLRPIETILSGPAASVIGAQHLGKAADAIVADMGGTTTDIALVEQGRPRLTASGARVGTWKTMVEAIDIRTVGLGGDSEVQLNPAGRLAIGPRRVTPVCVLAQSCPRVEDELADILRSPQSHHTQAVFTRLERTCTEQHMPEPVSRLIQALATGPLSQRQVEAILEYPALYQPLLTRLERQGCLARSSVTPTDAAHVLGRYTEWHTGAARIALDILAQSLDTDARTLAERILTRTAERIAQEIARKAWDEDGNGNREATALSESILDRLIASPNAGRLTLMPVLHHPVVGLGAPAATYFPTVARLLNGTTELPALGHVANAVGAIVGSVVSRSRASVVPATDDQGYAVHCATGTRHFESLDQAIGYAREEATRDAIASALAAGATAIQVTSQESESKAPVGHGYAGEVFISATVLAQAVGRPQLAE